MENAKNEIFKVANEILDKQDNFLSKQRIDGHLYMITEEINDSRFIMDLTNFKNYDFEEVNFPKEFF